MIKKAKKKKFGFIPLEEVIREELKDPVFRYYFERRTAITEIAHIVLGLRKKAGLTQAQLAKKADTTQAVIARLESAKDKRIPSTDLLFRIAYAANARMSISFDFDVAA